MIFNGPTPPAGALQPFLQQFVDTIRRAMIPVVSKDEATPRILLQSPNGTVYSITVSNTGTITATLNDGKTRV
jgi:hypothetical protein